MAFSFEIELEHIFNFMLLLFCYVNTRDKVGPK